MRGLELIAPHAPGCGEARGAGRPGVRGLELIAPHALGCGEARGEGPGAHCPLPQGAGRPGVTVASSLAGAPFTARRCWGSHSGRCVLGAEGRALPVPWGLSCLPAHPSSHPAGWAGPWDRKGPRPRPREPQAEILRVVAAPW